MQSDLLASLREATRFILDTEERRHLSLEAQGATLCIKSHRYQQPLGRHDSRAEK